MKPGKKTYMASLSPIDSPAVFTKTARLPASIFIMKRNTPTQNALVSAGTISTITVKSIANLKTIIKLVKMAFHKPSLSTEVVSHQGYEAVGWVKMEGQSCERSCRGQKSCLDPKS